MVARALGTLEPDRMDVVKLTRNSNHRISDFVSFKVVSRRKWKSRALNPSTWPVNVIFRKLVCKHNDTWRPPL